MINFYATRKVLNTNRIEPQHFITAPVPSQALQDWFVDFIQSGVPGKSLLLFVHKESHLCILVSGKSIRKAWPIFQMRLSSLLNLAGFPHDFLRAELEQMDHYIVAKTNSRSMLAHINQIKFDLSYWFAMHPALDDESLQNIEILSMESIFSVAKKEFMTPLQYWEKKLGIKLKQNKQ